MPNEDKNKESEERMAEMMKKAEALKQIVTSASAPQKEDGDEETMKALLPLLKDILEDGAMSLVLEVITTGEATPVAMLKMAELYPKLKRAFELMSKMKGGYGKVGKELGKKAKQLFESIHGKAKEIEGKIKDFSDEKAWLLNLGGFAMSLVGLVISILSLKNKPVHIDDADIKKISDKVHEDFLFWNEFCKGSKALTERSPKCNCHEEIARLNQKIKELEGKKPRGKSLSTSKSDDLNKKIEEMKKEQDAKLDALLKVMQLEKNEEGEYQLQKHDIKGFSHLSDEDKAEANRRNNIATRMEIADLFEKLDGKMTGRLALIQMKLDQSWGGAINENWLEKLYDAFRDDDRFEWFFQEFFYQEWTRITMHFNYDNDDELI